MHPMLAWRYLAIIALLAATGAGPTGAQSGHDHGPEPGVNEETGADLVGGVSRAFLDRPLPLDPGLTLVRHPIQGAMSGAHHHYEAGLTYHYLYHYLNAVRAFNEALRIDPGVLPAYAALSRALVSLGARSEARAVLDRGLEILGAGGDQPDPISRLILQLRGQAMSTTSDEDRQAYREALAAAIDSHPYDPELLMLRALNARGEDRIAQLNQVLEQFPDHVGAHHELVHAHENRREYEPAVSHGAVLARLAPGVAHARHMYGHNLMRVGRVPDARAEFSLADSLELAYFEREGIPEHYDWHHTHNLHLLALSEWHAGEVSRARSTLERRAALLGRDGNPVTSRLLEPGELLLAEGLGRDARQLADRILAHNDAGGSVRVRAHLVRAEALLLDGQVSDAETELQVAKSLRTESGGGGFLVDRWVSRVEVQVGVHGGDVAADDPLLDEVIEETLRDRGPDGWITSLVHLHALARSAEVAGAKDVARRVLEAMREHDPTFEPRIHQRPPLPPD